MGKGVTDIRSPQRQLAPDMVGPEHDEPTLITYDIFRTFEKAVALIWF